MTFRSRARTQSIDTDQDSFAALLAQAVQRFREGQLEQAIESCAQALHQRADEPEALHLMATLCASAGLIGDALDYAQRAYAINSTEARYLQTLGRLLNHNQDFIGAEKIFRQLVAVHAESAAGWQGLAAAQQGQGFSDTALQTLALASEQLGVSALFRAHAAALAGSGRLEEAAERLQQSLTRFPKDDKALLNLGVIRLRQGMATEAIARLEATLVHQPQDTQAWLYLGVARQSSGDLSGALQCIAKIEKIRPLQAKEQAVRGSMHMSLGDRAQALSDFDIALSKEPGNVQALAGQAELLEWEGRYEQGLALLEPMEAVADPQIALVRARLLRRVGRSADALALLEPLIAGGLFQGPMHRRGLFTLAELYDELAKPEQAFKYCEDAHRINTKKFDLASHRSWVANIISEFSRDRIQALPKAARSEPTMIFIVGLPRSGTSLAEQILARHPEVHPGGERAEIGMIARELLSSNNQGSPITGDHEALTRTARKYLQDLGDLPKGIRLVTDKMPLNFLHLGLIDALFPGARIVHCQRDLLDTALSCYFTDFLDPALAFTENQHDLAGYIIEYQRLMKHWADNLNLDMYTLDYESLVKDQEKTTRALVKFAGLDWDARCLTFQETTRSVDTASHAQVRKPLYSSSVGRSQPYRQHLAALRKHLAMS